MLAIRCLTEEEADKSFCPSISFSTLDNALDRLSEKLNLRFPTEAVLLGLTIFLSPITSGESFEFYA